MRQPEDVREPPSPSHSPLPLPLPLPPPPELSSRWPSPAAAAPSPVRAPLPEMLRHIRDFSLVNQWSSQVMTPFYFWRLRLRLMPDA